MTPDAAKTVSRGNVTELARRELLRDSGPLFLGLTVVLTAVDAGTWLLGQFDWRDVVVLATLYVITVLAWRRLIPARALSWVWSGLAAFVVTVTCLQMAERETAMQIGYVIAVLAIYPPLALSWGPTLVLGVAQLAIIAVTAFTTYAQHGHQMWGQVEPIDALLQCMVAFAGGCVALYFRRRSLVATVDTTSFLESRAVTDRLTGVLNRHGIEEGGQLLVVDAQSKGRAAFVLFIDINGLKNVNDTHGHAVGDRVIAAVAQAARGVVREGDLLGRWGGDEFVIVGSGTLPDPSVVQRRLEEAFDRGDLRALWPEGVSVGGASGDSAFPELLAAADADMYERRQRHRGRSGAAG